VSAWEPKLSLADASENTSAIRNIAVISSKTFEDYQPDEEPEDDEKAGARPTF
jgi:hypothetical protein